MWKTIRPKERFFRVSVDNCFGRMKADLDEIKEVVAMTRIGQMLLDEGMECGIERGMERGFQLTKYLMDKGRMDDLKRAMEDEDYRKKLLEELDLQNNSR